MVENKIRYDRQKRIQNWEQEKLANARVAIVGTGQLAQFTAASLAALGIGSLEIYDHGNSQGEGFLDAMASQGEDRSSRLEGILREMNPEIEIKVVKTSEPFSNSIIASKPDLVLDLTNSSQSKQEVLGVASSRGINAISASTGRTEGEMYFIGTGDQNNGALLPAYSERQQGAFTSEIFGGMITEEARKALMPLDERERVAKNVAYTVCADRRFSKEGDFDAQPYEDLSKKKVLIIGAGALGNFVALGAALEGIGKIDILDFDDVEAHNLNRQIMFYDSVGKPKSVALADKIKRVSPGAEVNGLVGKLDENTSYFKDNKPDVILDCVDNFATRAITNYFAVHYGIPMVSGGTNSRSGQVVVYEPGQSACIECKLGVEKALGMSLQGSTCIKEPDPSVIMTNEIVGGMMVGETLKVLDKGYGAPTARMVKYDSSALVRGGVLGPSDPCECSRGEIGAWLKDVKDRFSLQGGGKDGA